RARRGGGAAAQGRDRPLGGKGPARQGNRQGRRRHKTGRRQARQREVRGQRARGDRGRGKGKARGGGRAQGETAGSAGTAEAGVVTQGAELSPSLRATNASVCARERKRRSDPSIR